MCWGSRSVRLNLLNTSPPTSDAPRSSGPQFCEWRRACYRWTNEEVGQRSPFSFFDHGDHHHFYADLLAFSSNQGRDFFRDCPPGIRHFRKSCAVVYLARRVSQVLTECVYLRQMATASLCSFLLERCPDFAPRLAWYRKSSREARARSDPIPGWALLLDHIHSCVSRAKILHLDAQPFR